MTDLGVASRLSFLRRSWLWLGLAIGTDKRRALGRGLESLLPSRPKPTVEIAASAAAAEPTGKPLEIPVAQIDRNPFQTRTGFDEAKLDELAASITASGVVQPIIVRAGADGRYTLITGERRWLASQRAGKATIPAVVREVSDVQAMEMTIVENLQRADLNPMEQAHAFERLSKEFKLTQEQMAERTGKDRASIANFLRLLKLPVDIQMHVESGELSFGHAKVLLALPPEQLSKVAWKVVSLHLSVRSTEKYVQGLLNPEMVAKPVQIPERVVDPNVREAEDRLRRSLGLKVTIEDKSGRGKVIIEYAGVDDFDSILAALGSRDQGVRTSEIRDQRSEQKQIPCGDDNKKSKSKGKGFNAKGAEGSAKDATEIALLVLRSGHGKLSGEDSPTCLLRLTSFGTFHFFHCSMKTNSLFLRSRSRCTSSPRDNASTRRAIQVQVPLW